MTMPAGKYYIGDLCYVMHAEWDDVCDITIKDRECLDGEFTLADGRRFATYGTAYGDGVYFPNVGGECGVDSGSIGCIRVQDIAQSDQHNVDGGIVVQFDHPFETSEKDGTIVFGHVTINTNTDLWDDDLDYDPDYDEDEDQY